MVVEWDRIMNVRRLYYKVIDFYLYFNLVEKMRNELVEIMFNFEMFNFMKFY